MDYVKFLEDGELGKFRDQNPEFVENNLEKVVELTVAACKDQLEVTDENLSEVLDEVQASSEELGDGLERIRENGLEQ